MKPTILILLVLVMTGCRKVTYNTVGNPAYIRVFNSLNYPITLDNKDNPPPFLTMVIDPVFDASGSITGAAITGDFLDQRLSYAPPYPTNVGSTNTVNNEYPGNAKVLVGPVVNGFDLASWAQVPSGKHRVQFYSRTKNTIPFFDLPASGRKNLLVDSVVNWTSGEVYTMEVLQKDVFSSANFTILYMRNEQFTKIPFADSVSYVNFYNLSAYGYDSLYNYNDAATIGSPNGSNNGRTIRDTMNIYYTLYQPDDPNGAGKNLVPGYQFVPMTTVYRSFSPAVSAYSPVPLFAGKDTTGGIYSLTWQELTFLAPGYNPYTQNFQYSIRYGNYAVVDCTEGAYASGTANRVPNLNVLTPSGTYAERSFSAVSTIEWINNQVYLMTVQRQYPAPINN